MLHAWQVKASRCDSMADHADTIVVVNIIIIMNTS